MKYVVFAAAAVVLGIVGLVAGFVKDTLDQIDEALTWGR